MTANNFDNLIGKISPSNTHLSQGEQEILSDLQRGKYKDVSKVEADAKYSGPSKAHPSSRKKTDIQTKEKLKPRYPAYKYSCKGKGNLHEAVILAGIPVFLRYDKDNDEIKSLEQIEESSRLIKPPNSEEYPYESYDFENIEELCSYKERAKLETIDSLYRKAKSIAKKFNNQDEYKIILLSADIIWSYFQDKFSTTHYDCVIGDNGSGKSTVGDTFVSVGYRPVAMTDPSAANLFRVLGTIEPGQCTIVADEAEKIDKSSEIMSVLKTGYQIKGQVPRINMNIEKQQFFYTYCFKMIIAEKSPNQNYARGVLDRTFVFTSYKGKSLYDIKEVLTPVGDRRRQELLDELTDFRKLMLTFRLIHFKDAIADIDIGVDGRDKELCKPIIQLFYNTGAQKEIEAALFLIIVNLVSKYGTEVYFS